MTNHRPTTHLALLSAVAAVLTLIVVIAALVMPDFYHVPSQDLLIGLYAQDLVALPVAIALLIAIVYARRGSLRALMVWAGCLGYLLYGYLLYAFDRIFTPVYPAYVAIMSLSLFSLIALLARLDGTEFRRHVMPGMPVRLIAVVLFSPAILIIPWTAGLLGAVAAGTPSPYNSIVVLDLGLLIPACLIAAVRVWRRDAWGLILGGALLVKTASLGWSLTLGMLYYRVAIGPHPDLVQLPFYLFIATIGTVALVGYLRHLAAIPVTAPMPRIETHPTGQPLR